MTVEWYDLAQRAAAARTGKVVDRLCHTPVVGLSRPIAVRAASRGGQVSVTACVAGEATQTGEGADGLRVLDALGVSMSGHVPASLVIDSPSTLPALLAVARSVGREGRLSEVAAHVGWWADRADFPGTSAVIDVTLASRTRWVTGEAPAAERHPETWRRWLRISEDGCGALLDQLTLLSAGEPLPRLDSIRQDDSYAWHRAVSEHADGWDWRVPDTISRAATGLRARCDTADLWAAALLEDPLFRRRAVHTGHVIGGIARIPAQGKNKITVNCDRMDARLRAGASILGWTGGPTVQQQHRFSGTVTDTGVNGSQLALFLSGVTGAMKPHDGTRVTLLAAPPNEHASRNGRQRYRSLYSTRSSWLTTGRTPTPQRREVPLEVLIAGAED